MELPVPIQKDGVLKNCSNVILNCVSFIYDADVLTIRKLLVRDNVFRTVFSNT